METLTKAQEKKVIRLMVKEFLEDRLGIEATNRNIYRFSRHIEDFEREIQTKGLKKRLEEVVHFEPVMHLHLSEKMRAY